METPSKQCQRDGCDVIFYKKPRNSKTGWRDRKYCSRECVAIVATGVQMKPTETKICEAPECGIEFGRKKNQSTAVFASRKYCSRPCSRKSIGKKPSVTSSKRPASARVDSAPTFATSARTHIWRPDSWGGPILLPQPQNESAS